MGVTPSAQQGKHSVTEVQVHNPDEPVSNLRDATTNQLEPRMSVRPLLVGAATAALVVGPLVGVSSAQVYPPAPTGGVVVTPSPSPAATPIQGGTPAPVASPAASPAASPIQGGTALPVQPAVTPTTITGGVDVPVEAPTSAAGPLEAPTAGGGSGGGGAAPGTAVGSGVTQPVTGSNTGAAALPFTGSEVLPVAGVGAALLIGGAGVLVAARRRRIDASA